MTSESWRVERGRKCIKCKIYSDDPKKFYLWGGLYKEMTDLKNPIINLKHFNTDSEHDICLDCLYKSPDIKGITNKLFNLIKSERRRIEEIGNQFKYGGYNSKDEYQKKKKEEDLLSLKVGLGCGIVIILVIIILYSLS